MSREGECSIVYCENYEIKNNETGYLHKYTLYGPKNHVNKSVGSNQWSKEYPSNVLKFTL